MRETVRRRLSCHDGPGDRVCMTVAIVWLTISLKRVMVACSSTARRPCSPQGDVAEELDAALGHGGDVGGAPDRLAVAQEGPESEQRARREDARTGVGERLEPSGSHGTFGRSEQRGNDSRR